VFSSFSPLRREFPVVREMRRLCVWRPCALRLTWGKGRRVWPCAFEGKWGQVMEEAPGVVFVVMLHAMCGGAYRGVRKAGVKGQ
jgi:hypothetical protein